MEEYEVEQMEDMGETEKKQLVDLEKKSQEAIKAAFYEAAKKQGTSSLTPFLKIDDIKKEGIKAAKVLKFEGYSQWESVDGKGPVSVIRIRVKILTGNLKGEERLQSIKPWQYNVLVNQHKMPENPEKWVGTILDYTVDENNKYKKLIISKHVDLEAETNV